MQGEEASGRQKGKDHCLYSVVGSIQGSSFFFFFMRKEEEGVTVSTVALLDIIGYWLSTGTPPPPPLKSSEIIGPITYTDTVNYDSHIGFLKILRH